MGTVNNQNPSPTTTQLRRQAEKRLLAKKAKLSPRTNEEVQRLVHELEVHQIELEMQNGELGRAMEELELSRNTYAELYGFAPVGYFTFDRRGVILGANIRGAQLLGVERRQLVNTPFANSIADPGDREIFFDHITRVLQVQGVQRCEIKLKGKDGTHIHAQLQSVTGHSAATKESHILTSIIDDTAGKQMAMELRVAHDTLESIVTKRTLDLVNTNTQLTQEIEDRKRAEESLQGAFAEINRLRARLQAENIYLQQEIAQKYNFGEIIGQSRAVGELFSLIEQVAPQNATVLLLGETGTGKGVVARAIHARSNRKDRPMITVNCTALPANLIESELFGREKGAFTGADARQIGRFELAHGGTIFLDEIGDMPKDMQCKLLRVIQDGEFERLGSPQSIKVDVRIIAASNRDLEREIQLGRFREDLFYRINVFPIRIPPLRQRLDDIPLLVNHFVIKFNKKMGKKVETIAPATLSALQEYHWPGNIRELESVVERAVITSQRSALLVTDRFVSSIPTAESAGHEVQSLADLEQDHILQVLQKTNWRIEGPNGAALALGLNPSTLRARMRKFGISRHR